MKDMKPSRVRKNGSPIAPKTQPKAPRASRAQSAPPPLYEHMEDLATFFGEAFKGIPSDPAARMLKLGSTLESARAALVELEALAAFYRGQIQGFFTPCSN